MKILDFDSFCALPAGTIYSYYEPVTCTGLFRKGDTIVDDGGDALDFWEDSLVPNCWNGDPPSVDEIPCRWGLYDVGAEFAVYEPADIAVLASLLGLKAP